MAWLHMRVLPLLVLIVAFALWPLACGHEIVEKTADPGFRPDSEYAAAFVEAVPTATIAVHPTIVRRSSRTAHSFASQRQIIEALNERHLADAVRGVRRIDLGRIAAASQWELFEHDMQRIADELAGRQVEAQYDLVMEFLLPVNDDSIFGIQLYVLDRDGNNAFSFLLNSHHRVFVDAGLVAADSSEEARDKLIEQATHIGIEALAVQIEQASR